MQTCLSTLMNKYKKASTTVLFVSFLITFCVYPHLDIEDGKNNIETISEVSSLTFKSMFCLIKFYWYWILIFQFITAFSRILLSKDYNLSQNSGELINSSEKDYEYYWNYYRSRYDF